MISFSEKEKHYLKLAAEGRNYKEMSQEMNVSIATIQSGYRLRVLGKTGLSTTEEIVTYARQHGFGGPAFMEEEPDIQHLSRAIPGVKMAPTRAFYKLLEQHYHLNDCSGCRCYTTYYVMLIPGEYLTHLARFTTPEYDVEKMLNNLRRYDILEEQHNDGICRLTFIHLQKERRNS